MHCNVNAVFRFQGVLHNASKVKGCVCCNCKAHLQTPHDAAHRSITRFHELPKTSWTPSIQLFRAYRSIASDEKISTLFPKEECKKHSESSAFHSCFHDVNTIYCMRNSCKFRTSANRNTHHTCIIRLLFIANLHIILRVLSTTTHTAHGHTYYLYIGCKLVTIVVRCNLIQWTPTLHFGSLYLHPYLVIGRLL